MKFMLIINMDFLPLLGHNSKILITDCHEALMPGTYERRTEMNNISVKGKIDLHMHSVISDGTDTIDELLANVKAAGIGLFSVTDHDAIKGSVLMRGRAAEEGIGFISGVEFSCRDEKGKYHILGYGYDPDSEGIKSVIDLGHTFRMNKVRARLDHLKSEFGFDFPEDEIAALLALDNPGKPHIGNLMVKYGYAETKEQAISEYINRIHFRGEYVRPEQAIEGILAAGGTPVLAHPSYGSGDQLITGSDMDDRVRYLMDFGLKGLEAFYSSFTAKLRGEQLSLAEKYGLYVTAGSDYHGSNKLVMLADTGLDGLSEYPQAFLRFLRDITEY